MQYRSKNISASMQYSAECSILLNATPTHKLNAVDMIVEISIFDRWNLLFDAITSNVFLPMQACALRVHHLQPQYRTCCCATHHECTCPSQDVHVASQTHLQLTHNRCPQMVLTTAPHAYQHRWQMQPILDRPTHEMHNAHAHAHNVINHCLQLHQRCNFQEENMLISQRSEREWSRFQRIKRGADLRINKYIAFNCISDADFNDQICWSQWSERAADADFNGSEMLICRSQCRHLVLNQQIHWLQLHQRCRFQWSNVLISTNRKMPMPISTYQRCRFVDFSVGTIFLRETNTLLSTASAMQISTIKSADLNE